ncbi:sporulation protein YpjB [Bacillus canaveralius]|uniref:Sporulation protein YpjB n=1 Tax=Bacillus canaveralius TaxID=1403243 RepID=A0A2N5GI42_9BACI|nr:MULTISPECIES: sporulation protein YpjB [Bacillus]PLR80471.1 sporulation protein YpjB [Bacillus canaveralius]PLR82664.1 sporulation protein YpjB [Bacillus sp. V33-4]PLS00664.1 sporulation protein YpjB [Bacillus canaveralius]RSK51962.1 sporulation protein YpjB [Bacillus canaveralius]
MRAKFVILFLAVLLLAPISTVYSEQPSPLDKLDLLSDQALQMIKLQRYDDAGKLLEYFSEEFLAFTTSERIFSMDELRIITVAHDEAVEAAGNGQLNPEERLNRVTKFRLVVDAVTSTHQPLWTEMEDPIMTVFHDVKEAAGNGDNEKFHLTLNSFLSLYEVIYPSIKLDVSRERVQKLNTRVQYIDHNRPQLLSGTSSQEELNALQTDLESLFDEMTEDDADPSLWWVIISTGSIIIITLSYVGWRKYMGGQKPERNRSRDHKN